MYFFRFSFNHLKCAYENKLGVFLVLVCLTHRPDYLERVYAKLDFFSFQNFQKEYQELTFKRRCSTERQPIPIGLICSSSSFFQTKLGTILHVRVMYC